MRNVYVHLQSGTLIKDFVDTICGLEGRFKISSGLAQLDAKSILGIYGLDLSNPILLQMENDSQTTLEALKPFLYSEQIGTLE